VTIGVQQRRADDAHESCETDEIDVACPELTDHRMIEGVASGKRPVTDAQRLETCASRALQTRRVLTVRDDDGDRGVQRSVIDGVDQRLQVGAAAGDEDGDA
jgi:hypothetical protein